MFEDEIYEVSRDEFVGFIAQIKPECFTHTIDTHYDEDTYNINEQIVHIVSADDERRFAKIVSTEEETRQYVYEMPRNEERQAAKPVRKITLGTKEDVQAFFNALQQIQENKKNG